MRYGRLEERRLPMPGVTPARTLRGILRPALTEEFHPAYRNAMVVVALGTLPSYLRVNDYDIFMLSRENTEFSLFP